LAELKNEDEAAKLAELKQKEAARLVEFMEMEEEAAKLAELKSIEAARQEERRRQEVDSIIEDSEFEIVTQETTLQSMLPETSSSVAESAPEDEEEQYEEVWVTETSSTEARFYSETIKTVTVNEQGEVVEERTRVVGPDGKEVPQDMLHSLGF